MTVNLSTMEAPPAEPEDGGRTGYECCSHACACLRQHMLCYETERVPSEPWRTLMCEDCNEWGADE